MNKTMILIIAKYLGLFGLSRLITRSSIRIVAYHGIWFSDGHFGNHLFMNPQKFESRMKWLSTSPYSIVSLDHAIESMKSENIPSYSVAITVDDGWYGTFRYMLPSLEKYNLPATLYVYTEKVESQEPLFNIMIPALLELSKVKTIDVTNPHNGAVNHWMLRDSFSRESAADELVSLVDTLPVEDRNQFCRKLSEQLRFDFDSLVESRQFSFMNYNEIAEANRRGLDIQLHTHNHSLNLDEPSHVREEIRVNREKLHPHVTGPLEHFCYPSGIYREEMFEQLVKEGIKSATLVDIGLAKKGDEPFALKRILDGEKVDLIEFEAELSGFMELLRKARRVLSSRKL